MCGIVGYIGERDVTPILINGLKKLEYRGYDSAGIAIFDSENSKIDVVKSKGRLNSLENKLLSYESKSTIGIGHTRWATHGAPSDINSHPHISQYGKIAVVHNGIIENYLKLKEYLKMKGYEFVSETDTEVISHLIEFYYEDDIVDAVINATKHMEGSYAVGVVCADQPDQFVAVRKDNPLIVGISEGENFIASDIPAILEHTKNIYLLEDGEVVVLRKDGVTILNENKEEIQKEVHEINWDMSAAEKEGYEHFMLKEICEQPKAVKDTLNPRFQGDTINMDNISLTKEELKEIERIYIVACGTSYHAGIVAKYFIEGLTGKPVEVDIASEFRYRDPIINDKTLMFVISQSGETADTLAALREAKKMDARVISIVNVLGSSIARESDDVIYTLAGPEIAVASTKAYTTQLSALYLIALDMAMKLETADQEDLLKIAEELKQVPEKIEEIVKNKENIQQLAEKYYNQKDVFFMGRGTDFAVALEGSLKLKEISYIHSEAYAAGELKHGTIALIEDGTPVVALATQPKLFDKMLSNIKEVTARGAKVIAVAFEGDTEVEQVADEVIYIPNITPRLSSILSVVPLQLLAYYIAVLKECDVDKPRNLAKSVTVE